MRRWMLITFTAATFGLGSAVAQPPASIGPPTPVVPPPLAGKPAPMPATATPVTVIPEYEGAQASAGGCATCGAGGLAGSVFGKNSKIAAHFSKPRPAAECIQCGTLQCEWRFFLGSCRAFFDEGRFAPALPPPIR